ncbi:MAG: DNA polymerase III subunit gamma/tau [Planctomycetota bacterium]
MSYEVLTLKYRPKTFADLVGQRTVAETLQRAVSSGRVANAYLFCGSRGVGKTSSARILAKALNCPDAREGEPCNVCEICRAISVGEDLDVIEIDGASNRGIDDVRGIRDNAGYVPSRSRYKIYIIDEVHMLTVPAFNALLKVLEEPPPHVKFIFATTDPNDLPDTILSRCQRHEFRRISVEDIVERLRDICAREGIEAEDAALRALATRSEGGLRDSVSALDQVVSYAGPQVRLSDLEAAIGMLPQERVSAVFSAMVEGRLADLVAELDGAFWGGFDPHDLLDALTGIVREMMVYLAAPERHEGGPRRERLDRHAGAMNLDRALYALRVLLNASGDMKRNGHERVMLEMACIKVARSSAMLPVEDLLARLDGAAPPPPADPGPRRAPEAPSAAPAAPPRRETPRWQPPDSGARRAGGPRAEASDSGPAAALAEAPPRPAPRAPAPRDPEPAPPPRAAEPPVAPHVEPPAAAPTPRAEPPAPAAPSCDIATLRESWKALVAIVAGHSRPMSVSLDQARPLAIADGRVELEVPAGRSFVLDQLGSSAFDRAFGEATGRVLGVTLGARIVEGAAPEPGAVTKKNVHEDPAVQKFIQHFDGGITSVEFEDGQGV